MITVRNASSVDDPVVEVEVFYASPPVACHGVKVVPPHLGGSIFRNSKRTKRMTKRRRRSVVDQVVVDEDVVHQVVLVKVVLVNNNAVVDHHLEDLEGTMKRGTYPRHNVR